jgi:hypothetical protein
MSSPVLEMYSDARIAFEQEIRKHHPKIAMKIILASAEAESFRDEGLNIGTVAAEFNIAMEGLYAREQIEDMYTTLFHKLREVRKISIIQVPSAVPLPQGIQEIH